MLMHELTVAQSLLAAISAEAETQKARPVSAKISCGTFSAVNDELLDSAFQAISEGTVCEGMKLKVEHKPMQGRCGNCRQIFVMDFRQPECPKCGSGDYELLPDEPLVLEEIEFKMEQPDVQKSKGRQKNSHRK